MGGVTVLVTGVGAGVGATVFVTGAGAGGGEIILATVLTMVLMTVLTALLTAFAAPLKNEETEDLLELEDLLASCNPCDSS